MLNCFRRSKIYILVYGHYGRMKFYELLMFHYIATLINCFVHLVIRHWLHWYISFHFNEFYAWPTSKHVQCNTVKKSSYLILYKYLYVGHIFSNRFSWFSREYYTDKSSLIKIKVQIKLRFKKSTCWATFLLV